VERVTIVKLGEINQKMASRNAKAAVHDPARIQGGNWTMQGFRRFGHARDVAECHEHREPLEHRLEIGAFDQRDAGGP
jgi:hypothetical protein